MLGKENDDAFVIVVVSAVEFFTVEFIEVNASLAIDSEVKTVNNNIIIIVIDTDKYNEMADIGLLILKAVWTTSLIFPADRTDCFLGPWWFKPQILAIQ